MKTGSANSAERGTAPACIFPAFGSEYLGSELPLVSAWTGFGDLCERARETVGFDPGCLAFYPKGDFPVERTSQYASYLYSCAASGMLAARGITASMVAGYSMGLYAALQHAGAITFETGLLMIRRAHECILEEVAGRDFGMGVVTGLATADVRALLANAGPSLEVINCNNRHSHVVAGFRDEVIAFLAGAKNEGALNAQLMPMKTAYHSRFMAGAARSFGEFLAGLEIRDATVPVVSTLDQRLMSAAGELGDDLVANIHRNINWRATMERMIAAGVRLFAEAGPGRSLQRFARFIDGDCRICTMDRFGELA